MHTFPVSYLRSYIACALDAAVASGELEEALEGVVTTMAADHEEKTEKEEGDRRELVEHMFGPHEADR